jgi:hypothetical protein
MKVVYFFFFCILISVIYIPVWYILSWDIYMGRGYVIQKAVESFTILSFLLNILSFKWYKLIYFSFFIVVTMYVGISLCVDGIIYRNGYLVVLPVYSLMYAVARGANNRAD